MNSRNIFSQNNFGKILTALMFCLILISSIFAQQGGLDTTWGINNTGIYQDAFPILPIPSGEGDKSRGFGISEVLADGKIIAAGNVTLAYINNSGNAGYASDFLVRRLNADGSVDPTFGANGEARTTFYRWGAGSYQRSNNPTYTMKVQSSDGKIIIAQRKLRIRVGCAADAAHRGKDYFTVRRLHLHRVGRVI